MLDRWSRSEDHHYAVWGLRWSAAWFARNGAAADARACAEALSSIAASAGHPDALAALAHALGEIALAEGDADGRGRAARPRGRAARRTRHPVRARADPAPRRRRARGRRASATRALERLAEGYRARPHARRARRSPPRVAAEIVALGASLEEHLGRRAAADHDHAGLSRRELEVMRLAAGGLTNREIAERLVLSTRTVDMHMRNILAKLRCRTRTEAARRAAELGLL